MPARMSLGAKIRRLPAVKLLKVPTVPYSIMPAICWLDRDVGLQ